MAVHGPRVALVIPAWNEPQAIGAVLDEIPPGSVGSALVVVNSPDDPTAALARLRGARVLVQHQPGYGAACWTGAEVAMAEGAQVLAFLDGDYADPPAELPRVLAPVLAGRADLVLGCRDLRRFPDALGVHARIGNRLVRLLMRQAAGVRVSDLPSFKTIRSDALLQLGMREMTYGWTVEMLIKASRASLRLEEVSIEYRPRLGGQSKVGGSPTGSLRAGLRLLGCALAYMAWRPATAPISAR
jgi:glycosyltransferase involved in cell wall biosynthesis